MPAMSTRAAVPDWALDLGDGVFAVDTGFHRPRFDAAYLLCGNGRAAFVDTGTNHAVPRLLALLDALSIGRDAVEAVIPTHVHLDHAGGAGALMQALPAATLWVHPRGRRHMVDPAHLYASARTVYGQAEMDRSYGTLVPVPAARVRTVADDEWATIAGRRLRFVHTPGHARHHHCVWDDATRGWFTGDTFGLSYRELDTARGAWILPTSTPVQFEPAAMAASIRRLLAAGPSCIYLTHYGRVGDVPRLGAMLLEHLDGMAALGRRVQAEGRDRAARTARLQAELQRLCLASLRAHGSTLSDAEIAHLLAIDLELNAAGMAIWLDREAAAARSSGAPTAAGRAAPALHPLSGSTR
jgi:glyoxylase-like metal-dependent hydrolase (beta-lactamase superfamily II)